VIERIFKYASGEMSNPVIDEKRRHLLKGTISIFLAEALIVPTGFVTAIFLARYLKPSGYGLFALVATLILWIEWLSSSVFTNATIKFVGEASDWKPVGSAIMRLQLGLAVSVAAVLWVAAPLLSRLFNEPVLASYLRLFAIDIPISCLACANRNILAGIGFYSLRAWVTAAKWATRLVLIISFVLLGFSVKGAILGSIGASVVELGMSSIFVRTSLFLRSTIPLQQIWGVVAPLFMSAASLRFFRLDLFALKVLGGTAAQAGLYSAAFNLSAPPALLSVSLSPPLLSTLSRLLKDGQISEAKKIASVALSSLFWLLPFGAVAAGASHDIVRLIFGPDFSESAPVFSFLVFAPVALHAVNISIAILTATNHPIWPFMLTAPMVPIALLGHILLIPRLGGLGAAAVTTCVASLSAVVSVCSVYWTWEIAPPLRKVRNSLLVSGLGYAMGFFWPASGPVLILKLLVVGALVILCLFALQDFTPRELSLLRSVLRRKSYPDGTRTISQVDG
jgi:O-antigen/teichoic acid export membrane protein